MISVTSIKIRKIFKEGTVKAIVSIIIDDCFAVHDIKIIEVDNRLIVCMPNKKTNSGGFMDIVHPINQEARNYINEVILNTYNQELENA